MENNKNHVKSHAGGAFLAGFILGAIFASLLVTKKGRAVLREIINAGMEMIEDFLAERKDKAYEKKAAARQIVLAEEENENVEEAAEDIESQVAANEAPIPDEIETAQSQEIVIDEVSPEAVELAKSQEEEEKPAKLGSKRRLFKGIRKTKAN